MLPGTTPLITPITQISAHPAGSSSRPFEDIIRTQGPPLLNLSLHKNIGGVWGHYIAAALLTGVGAHYAHKGTQIGERLQALASKKTLTPIMESVLKKKIGKNVVTSLLWSLGSFIPWVLGDNLYRKTTKNLYQSKQDWQQAGIRQIAIGGIAAIPFLINQLGPTVNAFAKARRIPRIGNGKVAVALDVIGALGLTLFTTGWRDYNKSK